MDSTWFFLDICEGIFKEKIQILPTLPESNLADEISGDYHEDNFLTEGKVRLDGWPAVWFYLASGHSEVAHIHLTSGTLQNYRYRRDKTYTIPPRHRALRICQPIYRGLAKSQPGRVC